MYEYFKGHTVNPGFKDMKNMKLYITKRADPDDLANGCTGKYIYF